MAGFTFHLSSVNNLLLHWVASNADSVLYQIDPEFMVASYLSEQMGRAAEWAIKNNCVNEEFHFYFDTDNIKLFSGFLNKRGTGKENLQLPIN